MIDIKIPMPSGNLLTVTLYDRADAEFLMKALRAAADARGLPQPRAYELAKNEIEI